MWCIALQEMSLPRTDVVGRQSKRECGPSPHATLFLVMCCMVRDNWSWPDCTCKAGYGVPRITSKPTLPTVRADLSSHTLLVDFSNIAKQTTHRSYQQDLAQLYARSTRMRMLILRMQIPNFCMGLRDFS
jgi:hypothetical protein